MERLNKQEVESLTDREVKVAYERIRRDYSLGFISDKVTFAENTQLLGSELRERGYPAEPADR
jgi:hypothetical protein